MIIRTISDRRYLREKDRADYLDAERDLFQRWGATAARNLNPDDRRRLANLGQAVGWKRLARVARIATVRTIRRWYRDLIGPIRTKTGGKPQTSPETEALMVKLAVENDFGNDAWGRRCIAGEMDKLGIDISAGTVRRILRRQGIPTAPKRGRGRDNDVKVVGQPTADVALDFAQTVILDGGRICRMYQLFAIHIPTRTAELVGITEHPDADFMAQCARNLTQDEVGFLSKHAAKSVLMDRDTIFTAEFRNILGRPDQKIRRIPPRQPWRNGYVERFIQTIKNLALRKVFCQSYDALWHVTQEGIRHYNEERPHQGLGNRLITPPSAKPDITKPIVRIDRLDGVIHHYARAA